MFYINDLSSEIDDKDIKQQCNIDTSSSSNNTNSIITHANSINNGYNSYDGMGISPSPKSFDFNSNKSLNINNNKPMTLSDESHTHSNK